MKTVLIVDDDRVMTAILTVWLQRMGLAVLAEHDVPGALRVLKTRMVDAIILDLNMPGGCGTQVIQQLKIFQRTGTIPVVVLSANDDPSVAARALSCGADRFLVKPTSSENIAETLAPLFARAKQHEKMPTKTDRKPEKVESIIKNLTGFHAILQSLGMRSTA